MNLRTTGGLSTLCLALLAGTVVAFPMGTGSVASAVPPAPRTVPAAPTNLRVTVGPDGRVTLNWSDNSNNETGFRIVREIQAGPNAWFASGGASVTANVTSYSEM